MGSDGTRVNAIKVLRLASLITLLTTAIAMPPVAKAGEVIPEVDLQLTMEGPSEAKVNEDITFTMVVTNLGPDALRNSVGGRVSDYVSLTDLVPVGTTYRSSSSTRGSCRESLQTLTCNLGQLEKDEQAVVTMTVVSAQPGTFTNNAQVFALGAASSLPVPSESIDANPSNNHAAVTTKVGSTPERPTVGADLSVTVTDEPDPVQVNEEILYRVIVTNNSPTTDADFVEVMAQVPAAAKFNQSSATQGSCKGTDIGGAFVCQLPDGLMAGESAVITAVVTAPSQNQTVVASVTVRGAVTDVDPMPANNESVTTTEVSGGSTEVPPPPQAPAAADLTLEVKDSRDPVEPGETFTYTITVTNDGPGASPGGTVSMYHSATLDTGASSEGGCGTGNAIPPFGNAICPTRALGAGESQSFSLVVSARSDSGGREVAQSTLTSDIATVPDPNYANNMALETTSVGAGPGAPGQASLSLGIEDDPDPVKATQELTYTLNARNSGPEAADDVVVSDLLPAGVKFESAPAECSFDPGSRVVTCRRDTLAAGSTMSTAIVVVPERAAVLSNTAQVTSNTPDPELSDNQASESTTVEPAADLSVLVSASSSSVEVGEEITYTVNASNRGPDRAESVTLVDELPNSLTYRSASEVCSFDAASTTVSCAFGDVEPEQSVAVEIKGLVIKPGRTANTVRLNSTTFDPDTSDNTATAVVDAACDPIGLPADGQIAYPAGWSLVGVPGGTRVPADSKLYGWFDRNDEGDYSVTEPSEPVTAGRGYWAFFGCPRLVDVGAGSPTASFPLGAYRASMVGNPSGTGPVTVTGHGFAAQWDRSLSGGAGGYRYSDYQEPISLAPGEGAWIFSYEDTQIRMQE